MSDGFLDRQAGRQTANVMWAVKDWLYAMSMRLF